MAVTRQRRRWAVRDPVPPSKSSAAYEEAKRPSIHSRAGAGPIPPRVVNTTARKARPRSTQPGRCLASLSAARERKMAAASAAAARTWDGRREQETVTSMAVPWLRDSEALAKLGEGLGVRNEFRAI